MHTFKDKDGIQWEVDLNLSHIRYLESVDFSLATNGEFEHIKFIPPQENLFSHVITNPAICFEIVWACCKNQAEKRDINTIEEFASKFDGRALQESRIAVYEELPPFFPENLTSLKALISRYSSIQRIADEGIVDLLNKKIGDKELRELVQEELDNMEYQIDMAMESIRKKRKEKKD